MTIESAPRPKALLIAGPTASGKSALAVRLARRLGGRVVNADAMQVYSDLDILTARPDAEALQAAPHALYGTVDGAMTYSVSRWLADVAGLLAEAEATGHLPILVGGTGLYFKALTQGLSDIPAVPPAVREALRAWAEGRRPDEMHAELARRDPAMAARLRPTDPQRVLRALEVFEATGASLADFQGRRDAPLLKETEVVAVALATPRETLRARIDARFDAMIDQGALAEVSALDARGLDPTLPVMRAIGVPQLRAHLSGECTQADAIEAAKAASRQYIKRQETFLRHQLSAFRSVTPDEADAAVLKRLGAAYS